MKKNSSFKKFLILALIFLFVLSIGSSFATDDNNMIGDNNAIEDNNVVEAVDSVDNSGNAVEAMLVDVTIEEDCSGEDYISNASGIKVNKLGDSDGVNGLDEEDTNATGSNSSISQNTVNWHLERENNTLKLFGDSFESIQFAIDSANDNDEIVLCTNHRNSSSFYGNGSQIVINKSVTIDGNGYTLDANHLSRIFCIVCDNVTLKNLNLINTYHTDNVPDYFDEELGMGLVSAINGYKFGSEKSLLGGAGAVIRWLGDNGCLINTMFSKSEYQSYNFLDGKVISWDGKNGTIKNSYFGINYFNHISGYVCDRSIYKSSIIDSPIHGSYTGDLYGENVYITDAFVNSAPILSLSDISTYNGSSDCVSFNLTSANGLHFANETVNVCIFNDKYNKSFNCTSDSNGLVKFNLDKSLAVGNYLISVTYSDGKNNASGNSSLKILKAPAKLVTSAYKTSYASGKKFNVKVINSKTNKSISGVKLSLKVYTGSSYKTLTGKTNAKGIASFDLSKYSVGNHKVIVSANGNVASAKKDLKIKIVPANALVKLAKSNFKYKKADKLALTFTSKNTKKALSNLSVKVKIFTGKKIKTYNLKTDKNGMVKINTKGLSKGNHKIQISSNSKNYLMTKTTYIKVK
ncbi:MAG: hypothetical protein IKV87_01090 [Methanobrevibacter sp.]|nr:hypothetical protein [Methanobrevibacter sp.]